MSNAACIVPHCFNPRHLFTYVFFRVVKEITGSLFVFIGFYCVPGVRVHVLLRVSVSVVFVLCVKLNKLTAMDLRVAEQQWQHIRARLELPENMFYVQQLNNIFEDLDHADRPVLTCRMCFSSLQAITSYNVQRHCVTPKHIRNVQMNARPRPKPDQSSYDACSPRQCGFYKELVDFLVVADIPFEKIDLPESKTFLEKWTKQSIPHSSTLRALYVDVCYKQVIDNIRKEVNDSPIWIGIDETTDVQKRKVANVIVTPLRSDRAGIPRLLNCAVVEVANGPQIAECVRGSLDILWPGGYDPNRVLMLATDGAAYMGLAASILQRELPKLFHINCVVHGLRLIAETVRNQYADCNTIIANTKSIFLKAPSRVDLLRQMFPGLPVPPEPCVTRWGT